MKAPPADDRRAQPAADVAVLLTLASLAVLTPVRAAGWSRLLGFAGPASSDALGGAFTAAGVLLAAFYGWAAARSAAVGGGSRTLAAVRSAIVAASALLFMAIPTASDITARVVLGLSREGQYVSFPHDGGVLQTEAAMEFLLEGRNPYAERYDGTLMAQSHHSRPRLWRSLGFEHNPAFDFFPYPPTNLWISLPVRAVWQSLFGWYDQRVAYLLALGILLAVAWRAAPSDAVRPLYLLVLAGCPLYTEFFVQGFNDTFCVLFLILTVVALASGRIARASAALGAACGCKQFAWLLVPLFLGWLWHQTRRPATAASARPIWRAGLWPGVAVGLLTFGPFALWDAASLWHDLIAQGAIYPIRAEGLGMTAWLILTRAVQAPRDVLPLAVYGVTMAAPVAAAALWQTVRVGSVRVLMLGFAAVLFVVLLISRFFAPNYVWLLSVAVTLGLLPPRPSGSRIGEATAS